MLLLQPHDGRYPDDAEPARRWVAPDGLEPLRDPAGVPQVFIARGETGSVLTLRLRAHSPVRTPDELAIRYDAARFRLRSTVAGARTDGRWFDAPTGSDVVVDRTVALDGIEAAMIRALAPRGADTLEVEVELTVVGALPRWPWLVRLDGPAVVAQLQTLAAAGTTTREAVLDALAGLGPQALLWLPKQAGAIPPPPDAGRAAVAEHALASVTTAEGEALRVRTDLPAHLDVDLSVWRTAATTLALRWSLSQFLATVPDPAVHLFEVITPAPLQAAVVHVGNDVPLHPTGVARLEVELSTGSPSGRLHHAFEPGAPSFARLAYVRETAAPVALQWIARATVMTSAGPQVIETQAKSTGPMLELVPSALDFVVLRFAADAVVFTRVRELSVTLGRRTLVLTAGEPLAFAVGQHAPASVTVAAVGTDGARHDLGAVPLLPGGLVFGALALGIGETATVTLSLPEAARARVAYLAVQVEGGPWRTLDPGGSVRWPVRRDDRFTAPRLRYRTRHVPRDAAGATAAMVESPLRDASGESITLELPP
ncbi:MAG: hypothetical protein K1X88_12595 [Nannocystaceae bacterium]|nr:hypothetical protein [Nannocystaceae bacterium]